LFQDITTMSAGYEVPKGSGNSALFNLSFWFGGVDVAGQLKLSGTLYTPHVDLFPGPLTTSGDAEATPGGGADIIYPMSKSIVDNHIANWSEPGYEVPDEILNWPAHGDVSLDQDYYLAPFNDTDGDGNYTPENGDFPLIRGDFATYTIMNDKLDLHTESGGDPIGLEVHQMVYTFATDDYLNNTVFVHSRLINRGTQSLFDFKVGAFVDPDIGFSGDDYIGVNTANHVVFAYNGGATDFEYGENPPAIGVVSLNHDITSFAPIFNAPGPQGVPAISSEFYNYLDGRWRDGTPFTRGGVGYGGEEVTSFVFDGNPNDLDTWSEIAADLPPSERRGVAANSIGDFLPNDEICVDYAIVYNRDGDFLENVQGVIDLAGDVRDFYNDFGYECEKSSLGFSETKDLNYNFYPNPSNGQITIAFHGDYNLEILDITGKIVFEENELSGTTQINHALADGLYLVRLSQGNKQTVKRLVVAND
jgi:hypothetical protein